MGKLGPGELAPYPKQQNLERPNPVHQGEEVLSLCNTSLFEML